MLHHKTSAALAGDDWAEDEGTAESIAEPDRRNFIASFQIALAARAPAAIPETAENFAGGGRVDPAETRMVASRQDLSHELQTAKKKEPDSDCLQVMTESATPTTITTAIASSSSGGGGMKKGWVSQAAVPSPASCHTRVLRQAR
jgi:hypothetical protein